MFKYKNHLVINLFVPLTVPELSDYFSVYAVESLPLAAPDGDDRHYTALNVDFQAILYNKDLDYYSVVTTLAELPSTEVINLHTNGIVLRTRNMKGCGISLVEGSLADIKHYCGYSIVMKPLPAEVFKIDEHRILI